MGRPSIHASRMRKRRALESENDRNERLNHNRERNRSQRLGESSEDREKRLSQMRTYMQKKKTKETVEQRENRLSLIHKRLSNESADQREHRLSLIRDRLSNESADQRKHRLSLIHDRLANESAEQREHRLSLIRDRLSNESADQREHRLSLIHDRLANETADQRKHRLSLIHDRLANETADQREHRLSLIRDRLSNESADQREHRLSLIHDRLANESADQREHRLSLIHDRLANESADQREHRLSLIHDRLANESADQREHRLSLARCRSAQVVLNETEEQRDIRLRTVQIRNRKRLENADQFKSAINVFADVSCKICYKMLYPQQRTGLSTTNLDNLLPTELICLRHIVVCSRCSNNIKKRKIPTQAYWNKMTITSIPEEIVNLTEIEKKFLLRIVPFLQIIRVQNRFSQDWCKGQVVLFAKDIVELAEQLPLQPQQAGLVIVTENLENLQRSREFQVDMGKLNLALQWLLANNVLYRDVRPSFSNIIDLSTITQIAEAPVQTIQTNLVTEPRVLNSYINIDENTSILRGSFHQGNDRFSPESRGKQCTAVAAVACTAFKLHDPNAWCRNDVDYIVLLGDKYYRECILARMNPDEREVNREYLAVTELLPRIIFDKQAVNVTVNYEVAFNGHIENDNVSEGFPNLINALLQFFEGNENKYGVLTCNGSTVAVHRKYESEIHSYLLFDSHARGAKGYKAPLRGTSCCMRFNSVEKLYAILKRNLYISKKNITHNSLMLNVYSLTPVTISPEIEIEPQEQPIIEDSTRSIQNHMSLSSQLIQSQDINSILPQSRSETTDTETRYVYTTSMLHNIDEGVPDLSSVVSVNNQNIETNVRLAEITRKTAPPLNLEREKRMEELGWYFLFPDGKNGFGEERDFAITALDYFQARVMGSEKRFQRNDYLFFALSVVEYFRAKSSVSVSCRMRQGNVERTPQGLVDNMHLTMRNLRGSASYWKRCCAELIAMVRSLGAPTWFMTLSCNDLNWPDMIKALVIADGGDLNNVESLSFPERLALVQKYPIVVARQFNVRVNAVMRYIKNSNTCLGGPLQDYWYRIEFQNRGSPHLHMLLWCDGVPDFSTTEGIEVIEKIVSCSLNPDDLDLRSLVANVQIHKHTSTCYKDRNALLCRFGYPKAPADSTTCLGPDEALSNNGRFCILKRTTSETMVNNYNPELLSLWEGNMDIQPCGNITAVAYYVAKYASKCEPHDTGEVVREAITKAKRSGGTVWNQLFAVSMAILSQRLVSAPECAYRLCHLPLKMSSRKAVFVNSCKPEERFRLLRFDGDDTSIYNNIFDRYVLRPDELENISLAEFAVRYETVSSSTWVVDDDGDIEMRPDENQTSRYIKLRDNSRMRIRHKPAVLRTRYYTINSDKEAYYYNLLVCHIPFRNENELLSQGESAEECFLRRQGELRPLLNDVSSEEFAHVEQVIQQALAQATALNAVHNSHALGARNEPLICADEHIVPDHDDYCDDLDERTVMPDDVFFDNVRRLNVQQNNLFQKITQTIRNDLNGGDERLLLFITGGAGSGKSFVLKLLVEHIKRCYAPTVDSLLKPTFVEVASLTGVAARQIFGKTLHSVFYLPIEKGNARAYTRMTGQKLEQERRKWRYIRWLVIDEISMISYENLRMIHLRLQEFKNNDLLFGGISILLFGDIMQLPPVKGNWCFMQPAWCSAEINLWHQFRFCELTINMRQRHDQEFIDLLNHLRVGELTAGELEVLYERRRIPLMGDFADGSVIRIYPTVKQVDAYNNKMTAVNAASNRMYKIYAIDESREAATYGKKPPDNVIPSDVNNCGGLLAMIHLAVESRVMLRRNIAVSDGLVNGTMGVVKGFKWPALRRDQLEEGEMPDAVLIKFDDDTIGIRLKDVNGFVSIPPLSATFQATRGYGNVERRMIPIILCWAVTVHKLQGTTLEKAVIDLGKKNFAKGQVYVALSRVKTLEGLAISDLEPSKLLIKPHDERALAEMQRLRLLGI